MTFRIAAHEFRYQLISFQMLLTFGALFCGTFLLTANAGEFVSFAPGGTVLVNAPHAITDTLIKLSVFLMFALPPFISSSILKDVEFNFAPFIYSAPISKAHYLNGRFLGSFAALLIAASGAPLGMLIGTLLSWADPALLGPTNLTHYAVVFSGIIAPSLLAVSCVIFAVTVLSRSLIYTYIAAIALLLFYLLGSEAFLPPLFDPFMFRIFQEGTQYWTATERNTQLIPFSSQVLANRGLWLLIAGVTYSVAFGLFSFRKNASLRKRPKNRVESPSETAPVTRQLTTAPSHKPQWNSTTSFKQLTTRLTFEIRAVLTSPPFLILLALCSLLLFFSLSDREVMYGVNAHPLTRLMLRGFSVLTIPLLGVSAFYGAEILWRERSARCHEIIDALPVPNWVFVVSKVGALLTIMTALFGVGFVMSVGLQLAGGHTQLELGLYLERGILIHLLPTIFFAILACFFQVVSRNRYFGMALIGVFLAAIVASRDSLGWEHPLLSYGFPAVSAPASDMNRYGGLSALAYWMRAYWAAMAGFLLITSYLLWPRGVMQPLRYRLRALRALRTRAFLAPATLCLTLGLISAGTVYYNTNIVNTYAPSSVGLGYRQNYEERYRQYERLPMPRTVAIEIDVDLFPYQRRIEVQSTHELSEPNERGSRCRSRRIPSERSGVQASSGRSKELPQGR